MTSYSIDHPNYSAYSADFLQADSARRALRETQKRRNIARMEIGPSIRKARKAKGWTLEELANAVGTDTGNLSRLERGLQGASQELLEKLLNALGISLGETIEQGPPITSPWRVIPIVGTAQMGNEGYWYALEAADGYIELPSMDREAYALRLKGDSMSPAIKSGWIAVCEPNHRLVPLEYVMIRLHDGESMVKELLRATDEDVTVQSVNDAYGRRTIPIEQIETMHYVAAIVPPGKIMA